ncbi:class I SAM-dependent methyltransferase [Pantanalinema sp. GBBB05]|uniref:class I SAM-dependent methyltransferase n=1 Tax=Pantanalinema sp. GBBB05 TaxID=2604139 RepID=UPI001DB777EC|nr:class I SAM-dependent methyltransferase [Pantanalinema sp. GBBB05]
MTQEREFPDWEQLYQEKPVETMPWFNPELDPDLEHALIVLDLQSGTFLDLGTGPATQAIALAKRGFQVTATDLSVTAVTLAQQKAAAEGLNITFQQDDILNSHLDRSFHYVLDRGVFHVFPPDQRADYVTVISRLVRPNGYLFLKCFSHLETRESGPYRFTPEEINQIFGDRFVVQSVEHTVYHGTLEQFPQALFCILQRKPGSRE